MLTSKIFKGLDILTNKFDLKVAAKETGVRVHLMDKLSITEDYSAGTFTAPIIDHF